MSILSTNHRLISIGESYSAGNGIDITDQVISVTGDATPYSAGENIDIQDHIISGKDWSQDITEASSHAYNETTAWVQENYANSADMTYISAVVDTKLDASAWSTVSADYATEDYVIMADNITYNRATGYVDSQQFAKESACQSAFEQLDTNKLDASSFTDWQNGQYSTDLQTIEGQIANKYDTSSFAEVSGTFYTNDNPSGFITGVDLSPYYTTEEANSLSSMLSGAIDYVSANADNVEVTNVVQTNSGVWNEVTNKLDTTSFSDVSGSFLTAVNIPESANWEDATTAYQSNSASYITAHQDLSNYYTKDETSGKEELAQAFADIPVGDPEVNAYVTDNSATINGTTDLVQNSSGLWDDVAVYQSNSANYLTAHQDISTKLDTTAFSTVSGDFLTAAPADMATTGDVAELAQTVSETYQVKGDYLTTADSANFYTNDNPSGFLTEHQSLSDLMSASLLEYSGSVITAYDGHKFAGEVSGDPADANVNQFVYDNSARINDVNTSYENNSATYLTAHQDLSNYYTTAEAETLSSMLSGAIDYVSANAGDEFPVSADEAIQYVQTNSGTIDDTVTSYQTNSGTFLTAHQAISADEWNDCYDNVNTNSGAWGGEALPITGRDGIDLEIDNGTLYIGASALESTINDKLDITSFGEVSGTFLTGVDLSNYYTKDETSGADEIANALENIPTGDQDVNNYVISNSAIIDDAISTYQTNSGTYLTAHQSLDGYATEDWVTGQGYITGVSIPESATWNEVSTTVQTNSSNWDDVSNKLDTTSFSDVSGSFLTAHQDLSDYQTIEGMTAYQPVGDYAITNELEQVSAEITATIPSTAGLASESYVQTNSAVLTAMIYGKQDTLTFGYDEQDRINSINSSALAGGGGVPQSAFDELKQSYDALSSMIATYSGQWLPKYTAEYVGKVQSFMSDSNPSYIELQPNTFNIQYSAHFELGQANRYKCGIGLYKSTEPNESEYVYSASYSAVSENTKIVDISGTLEIDTSIGYDRFYLLKDGDNVFGEVSATITAQYYL